MTATTKETVTEKRTAIFDGTLNLIAERGFHPKTIRRDTILDTLHELNIV